MNPNMNANMNTKNIKTQNINDFYNSIILQYNQPRYCMAITINSVKLCQILLLLVANICLVYSYVNPVQGLRDTPDPGVIYNGNSFYATTTGGWDGHAFPIWKSDNLQSWVQDGWGLYQKPIWASKDFWAPQIHKIGSFYQLYYTARDSTDHLCIGVAYAEKANGPFTDIGHPLLRNQTQGVIDATVYSHENGTIYLVYKTDGNAHGKPTQIYAIQMSIDGRSVHGSHYLLIRDSLSWQRGIVEAPWIIKYNQFYFLFYSSCGYHDACYSVGVARSKNILGTYQKYPTPVLHTRNSQSDNSWQGPGHCSIVKTKQNNYAIVYHAWPHGSIGTKRLMLLDEVRWVNDWPVINTGFPSEGKVNPF